MNSPTSSKKTDSGNEGVVSSSTTISNQQSSDIKKCENVGPVFRIIEAYDKRNVKALDRNYKEDDSNTVPEAQSRQRGDLYAGKKGPVLHKFSNPMITPPIIGRNLWRQFKDLPIFGAPTCSAKLEEYQNKLIREFSCPDLDDTEFNEIQSYCNPDNMKTGKEIKMSTSYPITSIISRNLAKEYESDEEDSDEDEDKKKELCILKKAKKRRKIGARSAAAKLLKYRGFRHLPLKKHEDGILGKKLQPPDLDPGKDVLYRIRVFRPFTFQITGEKHVRGRHSVFNLDIVALGRQPLTALRDQFPCRNELDMRVDRSHNPDDHPLASAKTVFPSGFMFINNVFYVDQRPGCRDMSAVVRGWARERGLGDFPVRGMDVLLQDTLVRLAHPEVYMHQGVCEHVFLFSEVRLLSRADPLHLAAYPCHTLVSQHQSIYCTTCAEFSAKWLIIGSNRVPFDPAFFCETCFKEYLYIDGKKIGDFKAYPYKGNELMVQNPNFGNVVV